MPSYIRISTLNDFIFCPRSIYYHELYQKYNTQTYQDKPQITGKFNHESIDTQTYSTSKSILQGITVYSNKYGLLGKIDLYDKDKNKLIERKTKIKEIYQGYKRQLYAQYFCMKEMGDEVKGLQFHSLNDNKVYKIPIPDKKIIQEFEDFLNEYKKFDINEPKFAQNPKKCIMCIYKELCDYYL